MGSAATVDTSEPGTLVGDLYAASARTMVWRGVPTTTADDKPSKPVAKIDKALAKRFERYPASASTTTTGLEEIS